MSWENREVALLTMATADEYKRWTGAETFGHPHRKKKDRVIPLPSVDHLLNAVIQPVAATPQLFNQSTSDIVAAKRESCRLGKQAECNTLEAGYGTATAQGVCPVRNVWFRLSSQSLPRASHLR